MTVLNIHLIYTLKNTEVRMEHIYQFISNSTNNDLHGHGNFTPDRSRAIIMTSDRHK